MKITHYVYGQKKATNKFMVAAWDDDTGKYLSVSVHDKESDAEAAANYATQLLKQGIITQPKEAYTPEPPTYDAWGSF